MTARPQTTAVERYAFDPIDKCGAAKLCNSALLFRTREASAWRTPDDIPVDVTEHFRERVVPHPILLLNEPLVNYGATLVTHRSQSRAVWGSYQVLLIGSVFALTPPAGRQSLAAKLWHRARTTMPLYATALLATGRAIREARALWEMGSAAEKARFVASSLRRPRTAVALRAARERHASHWAWLQHGAFADFMREASIVAV